MRLFSGKKDSQLLPRPEIAVLYGSNRFGSNGYLFRAFRNG
jgi:hypothetical protein